MTVGEKIKYYRSKKNLDVKELSQRSGISADAIRKYEQGQRKPKYEQLQKLATGLQISLNNFLDLNIDMLSISQAFDTLFNLQHDFKQVMQEVSDEKKRPLV